MGAIRDHWRPLHTLGSPLLFPREQRLSKITHAAVRVNRKVAARTAGNNNAPAEAGALSTAPLLPGSKERGGPSIRIRIYKITEYVVHGKDKRS